MSLMEKMRDAKEAVGRFTQEQIDARERRLSDPVLQMELERIKSLLKDDVKKVCKNGLSATWRFTLGAPLSVLWEGTKEFGSVVGRNFSVKNPKNKRSYSEVPAT